ncbi:hypothetical protein G9A89_001499 [Geosiphon pyriformis]|nr:hypothetical protein G9A89_001499 [Geosiphon pyriformis]
MVEDEMIIMLKAFDKYSHNWNQRRENILVDYHRVPNVKVDKIFWNTFQTAYDKMLRSVSRVWRRHNAKKRNKIFHCRLRLTGHIIGGGNSHLMFILWGGGGEGGEEEGGGGGNN